MYTFFIFFTFIRIQGTLIVREIPGEKKKEDPISWLARADLPIVAGNVTSLGAYGNADLSIHQYTMYNWGEVTFKQDLIHRGFLDAGLTNCKVQIARCE